MINCRECNSSNMKYSGALMAGRKKMAKLTCKDCGSTTFINHDVFLENSPEHKSSVRIDADRSIEETKVVVTSAVVGHQPNEEFLRSLETYCQSTNATLL